jgi:hypothetical protein
VPLSFAYPRFFAAFASSIFFFASRRFFVFLERDVWRLIQCPRFGMMMFIDDYRSTCRPMLLAAPAAGKLSYAL